MTLSNEIFRDELLSLYREKDQSYQEVRDAAMAAMERLIREMESGLCDSPVIAEQMETLSEMLSKVKGKKVYGYLKKPVKAQVDAIVDELGKLPEVAECYEHWNRLRDELECYYKDTPREHKPLSQQKEFKAIKNMVIQEAEQLRLGMFTFEDASIGDEVDEDQEAVYRAWSSRWEMAETYQNAKEILSEYENTEAEKAEQVRLLERLWDAGFTVAAHLLGKCWRDGMGVLPDDEQAELWFRRATEAGHDFSQYALGKLLQCQNRIAEAVFWYEKAAAQDDPWAAYRLGKLYLEGTDVPKDTTKAVKYLTDAAQEGSQFASTPWASCTSPAKMWLRTGSRHTAGSRRQHLKGMSTRSSSWITSMTAAVPMCSSLPPSCSTTWARSFRTAPFRPARRAAREWTVNCSRRSVRRRSPWGTSRTTMRMRRTWAA